MQDSINADTISSSHCLLAMYKMNSIKSLLALVEFGRRAIQHKRIALVLKLGSGVTLKDIENTHKLPFLITAELENGEEQFLCPVIGQAEPWEQQSMCKESHVSTKDKVLRVGIIGIRPWVVKPHQNTGEHRSYLNLIYI